MSRARHKAKHHAAGGKVSTYAGADSNVMKEAHERKRGGRVHHGEGEKGKERHDRKHRKHGGRVHAGHPKHHADGGAAHHSHMHSDAATKHKHGGGIHHRGRARGGRIGAEKVPLSSAARIKEVTKGEQGEDLGQH